MRYLVNFADLHKLVDSTSTLCVTLAVLSVVPSVAPLATAAPKGNAIRSAGSALFKKLDINQDGWLSGTELNKGGWLRFDTNHNKEVTRAEFLAGYVHEHGTVKTAKVAKTTKVAKIPAVTRVSTTKVTTGAKAAPATSAVKRAPSTPAPTQPVDVAGAPANPPLGEYAVYQAVGAYGFGYQSRFTLEDSTHYHEYDNDKGTYTYNPNTKILVFKSGPLQGYMGLYYTHGRNNDKNEPVICIDPTGKTPNLESVSSGEYQYAYFRPNGV